MRKLPIFLTAILASLPVTLLAAGGLHAEEAYYSGSQVCGKDRTRELRLNEWQITFGSEQPETVDLLYRERGTTSFSRRSGPLVAEDGTFVMYEKDRPWMSFDVAADRETLDGTWIDFDGKPGRHCNAFTLTRTTPPLERIDALLALYATPEPTVEDFVAAAHQRDFMPPVDLLSALDRQAYADRLDTARPDFEARFDAAQTARIEDFDMTVQADRAALVAQTQAIVAPSLVETDALDDSRMFVMALRLFYRGADRLADSDDLEALPLDAGDKTCTDLSVFGNSSRMEEVEMLVGLPFEYWDRPLAERVLATAEACGAKPVTSTLTRNYPQIEARAVAADWLRTEAARIAALPATLDTLRENDWLSLENKAMKFSMYHYGRFAEPALKDFRQKAIADGVQKVTAAYSEPGEEKAANALCMGLPRLGGHYDILSETCRESRREFERAEARTQCDQAILDSGLDDATTATHLHAPAIDRDAIPLRDWICEMADEGGVTMSFDEGSGFFGSGLSLTMRFEDTDGIAAFKALLGRSAQDDTVLEVTKIEALDVMEGAEFVVPEEGPHVCLFIPYLCMAEIE